PPRSPLFPYTTLFRSSRSRVTARPRFVRLCRFAGDPDDAFDDVVNVREVPLHVSKIEDVDRLVFEDRLCEDEQRHIRPAPRAIEDRKSTRLNSSHRTI